MNINKNRKKARLIILTLCMIREPKRPPVVQACFMIYFGNNQDKSTIHR